VGVESGKVNGFSWDEVKTRAKEFGKVKPVFRAKNSKMFRSTVRESRSAQEDK
jgi:hypothetical protein